MARGITQDQVNAVADAVLRAGGNPTVEKVRAELGAGSPNTVTRMLNVWRNQLGERLHQLSSLPEVPSPVGQPMMALWQQATEHAERVLEGRFTDEQAKLESARASLAQERETWENRLTSAEVEVEQAPVARDLAEQTCAALQAQLQDSHALRADLTLQRDRLQAVCDRQILEIESLRTQMNEVSTASQTNRTQQEQYLRGLEDRAHQEIDRARREAKHWQQRFETSERSHQSAVTSLREQHHEQNEILRSQLRNAEQEVARYARLVTGLEKALAKTQSMVAKQPPARKSQKKKRSTGPKAPVA